MKIIVETKGAFGLLCPYTRAYVRPTGPTLVGMNSFMSERIAAGQLTLLAANIKMEATDEEFLVYLAESKSEKAKGAKAEVKAQSLAIASFAANFAHEDADEALDPTEDDAPENIASEDEAEDDDAPPIPGAPGEPDGSENDPPIKKKSGKKG